MPANRHAILLAVCLVASAPFASAQIFPTGIWGGFDIWEMDGDDTSATENELVHGSRQLHDANGPPRLGVPDQDWMIVATTARHSYEARVSGTTLGVQLGGVGGRLDRVNAAAILLSTATYAGRVASLRWAATDTTTEFVRVIADETICYTNNTTCFYEIEFHDTTYHIPRWNNSASQLTILLVQNTTNAVVTGDIHFYLAAGGSPIFSQAMTVPANGAYVLNTSTIPALQGLSGVAQIAHQGAYGALCGKAVALEPATGFTFDTAIAPTLSNPTPPSSAQIFTTGFWAGFDVWESAGDYFSSLTQNELVHGSRQVHDARALTSGIADQDWMIVSTMAHHSYEARVSGTTPRLSLNGLIGRLDRVNSAGALLTPATYAGRTASLRWAATDAATDFVRLMGDPDNCSLAASNNCFYTIDFYDTTSFIPRWNNTASQLTVFLIQNTTNAIVTGDIHFYTASGGNPIFSQPLTVPAHGAYVLNTSTIPALQGVSGVAQIAQLGGYGALVGKAVALEPTTGFTFDTAISTLPR